MTTTVHQTRRWRGIVGIALLSGAIGLIAKHPSILLLSIVGIAFAAYPHLTTDRRPELSIDRTVTPASPTPGETATVSLTVTNEGSNLLSDLRIVDGVPPMLSVVDGSPRCAVALSPGASKTIEYDVLIRPGVHRFRAVTAISRDLSGRTETEVDIEAETVVRCRAAPSEPPLRDGTNPFPGPLPTESGGSGIEFYQTREYRSGDDLSRIDWRRFAKTGELASTEFREERTASILLCVDARPCAYRAVGVDEPHAVAYAVEAADQFASRLLPAGHQVGLTALGATEFWLDPDVGPAHARKIERALAAHPAFSMTPPDPDGDDEDVALGRLVNRLHGGEQVLLFSPLADDAAMRTALEIDANGSPVTVLNPDVTGTDSIGGRLALIERDNRRATLRRSGIPVVDWSPDDGLAAALLDAPSGGTR